MKIKLARYVLICMTALVSCHDDSQPRPFDLQGHRGARGLMPENTLSAFETALQHGVTTLELDVVISADDQVVVSHEPYMSSEICRTPDGSDISLPDQRAYNLYKMTYDSISAYDCGTKVHPRFPDQKKFRVSKPLLSQVFKATETYLRENNKTEVAYNIEIKSRPEDDRIYHPEVPAFSDLVYSVLKESGISMDRFTIQSFDFRVLKYWHEKYPAIRLAALVEGEESPGRKVAELEALLGFKPDIYSPDYKLLDVSVIRQFQDEGIRVIPWTVNEPAEMERLRRSGVDGIITDYPDRAQFLLNDQ